MPEAQWAASRQNGTPFVALQPRYSLLSRDIEADVESQVAAWEDPETRARIRRLWEGQPDPPETMPAFDQLLLDQQGNAWVREYAPRAEENPNRFYVFSADGIWLGSVAAPIGMRVLTIGSDHVIGVSEDEFGVEVVSVHRLGKPD